MKTKRSQTSQAQPGPARPTQTTKLQVSPNRMQKWSKTVHFGHFSSQLPRGPFAKRFGRSWLTPPKKKQKKNEKTLTRQKPWKNVGPIRILTKKMILVRILDEFEKGFRDRRLGGPNVASRFVCVSCTGLFESKWEPFSRASSVRGGKKNVHSTKTVKKKSAVSESLLKKWF